MRLSQLIDDAVAADREALVEAATSVPLRSLRRDSRRRDRAPACAAPARSTACCCSTSRRACRPTRRCSARSASTAPRRRATPERSIRWRRGLLPLCFGEATKFAQALLDARQGLRGDGALRHRDDDRRRRGRDRARRAGRVHARRRSKRALPRFVGRIAQVPPRHSALKYQRPQLLRIRARGHRDPARAARHRDRPRARARRLGAARRGAARRAAARAPTSACWPRTSARAGLLRAPRRVAPHRQRGVSTLAGARDAGRAGGAGRHRRAMRCCCRPMRCLRALPRLDVDAADARRLARRGSASARCDRRRRRPVPLLRAGRGSWASSDVAAASLRPRRLLAHRRERLMPRGARRFSA